MNPIRRALAIAVVLALSVPAFAAPATPVVADPNNLVNSMFAQNPSFIGLTPCVIPETSATAVLCATGPGVFYGLWVSGQTVGQYAVLFNTISALVDVNTRANMISPAVFANTGASSASIASGCGSGGFCPPYPVRFSANLYIAPSKSGTNEIGLYRLDSDNATFPLVK